MTYYTVERVHAPCGIRDAVRFRLTYQQVWRSEIQQWCDFKVAEEELGPDPEMWQTPGAKDGDPVPRGQARFVPANVRIGF